MYEHICVGYTSLDHCAMYIELPSISSQWINFSVNNNSNINSICFRDFFMLGEAI